MNDAALTAYLLFAALWSASPAAAQAPDLLTYQGRLKEGGTPVDGARDVEISLWDQITGGSKFTTGVQGVTVSSGLFRTTFTVPSGVDLRTGQWYLEVKVGAQTLSPRERLASSPYAVLATSATTLVPPAGTDAVLVPNARLILGQGDGASSSLILIGNTESSASVKLHNLGAGSVLGDWRMSVDGAGAWSLRGQAGALGALRTEADGDVGVGTTFPEARLHVSSGTGWAGDVVTVSTGTSSLIRMTGLGEIFAHRFIGDGSGLTNVAGGGGGGWTDDGTVVRLTSPGDSVVVQSSLTVQGLGLRVGDDALIAGSDGVAVGTTPALNGGRLTVKARAAGTDAVLVMDDSESTRFVISDVGQAIGGGFHFYEGPGTYDSGLAMQDLGPFTRLLYGYGAVGDPLRAHGFFTGVAPTEAMWITDSGVIVKSTLTVEGNAFSVGGSTLAVKEGRVGIRVADPQFELDLLGRLNVDGAAFGGSYFLSGQKFLSDDGQVGQFRYGDGGATFHRFFTAGLSRLTIEADGKIGVGTEAPEAVLHISSDAPSGAMLVKISGTTDDVLSVRRDGALVFQSGTAGASTQTAASMWQFLKRQSVGAGSVQVSVSFPERRYLRVTAVLGTKGTADATSFQFNGDTGNNYGWTFSKDGGSEVNNSGSVDSEIEVNTSVTFPEYVTLEIYNPATSNKLVSGQVIQDNSGSLPSRIELAGRWSNTTDPITSLALRGTAGNTLGTVEIFVYGHD